MHRKYMNTVANDLWSGFFLRREKMARKSRCRKNLMDFIALLSNYIPLSQSATVTESNGLYDYLCSKPVARPCGYAVSIAIEKLPGDLKNSSKK